MALPQGHDIEEGAQRTQVLIRAKRADHRSMILVEDDGIEIPEQWQVEVLQRGNRLDEKVPGSGLGLDIAQDIAGFYRGSITLDRGSIIDREKVYVDKENETQISYVSRHNRSRDN